MSMYSYRYRTVSLLVYMTRVALCQKTWTFDQKRISRIRRSFLLSEGPIFPFFLLVFPVGENSYEGELLVSDVCHPMWGTRGSYTVRVRVLVKRYEARTGAN